MKLVIIQDPIEYKLKDGSSDFSNLHDFVNRYLQDGGDPRRLHKACPELELTSEVLLSSSLVNSITPHTDEESYEKTLEEESKDVTT